MIKGTLMGFLADEKGLKEFFCLKGASGLRFCPHCTNVVNKVQLPDDCPAVGLDDPDRSRFDRCTNRLFSGMLTSLHGLSAGSRKRLDEAEVDYGIHYDPHSMFVDPMLKPILNPMDNYIRDPQHTLFSTGVAESEVAAVVIELKKHGWSLEDFKRYSMEYIVPKRSNKVNPNWFKETMFSHFGTKHFAGDMISVVLLLGAFLEDEVTPGLMEKHIKCFLLLVVITSIVMSGGDATPSVIAALRIAVDKHAAIYREIYDEPRYYKIKWHHLLHLPDDLRRMGKLLSCFPMERKHKDIKVQMLTSFRSVERSTVYGYLNASITSMLNGQTRWSDEHLLNAADGRSLQAKLSTGRVCSGDIVLFTVGARGNRALGKVREFIDADGILYAHLLQ